MSLQLQMIGTGSAFAKNYYNNNALVKVNKFTLLIDCGNSAPRALNELGVALNQIDGVLITHLHSDHVGGLEEVAFQLHYLHNKKIKLFVPSTLETTLWENTLKGGMENAAEGLTGLSSFFDVTLLQEGEPLAIADGLTVEILRTEHIPQKPSYSLFINKDIFYSADVQFNPELLLQEVYEKRGCRYILHDCQLQGAGVVHAALDQLLTLPENVQERILLMHYGDNMEDFVGRTDAMKFLKQHEVYDF